MGNEPRLLSVLLIAGSILCIERAHAAKRMDVVDCRENMYRQGYINRVNDDCPPDFTDAREDFTLALQGDGHECVEVLGLQQHEAQFDRGEARFEADVKKMGIAAVCKMAQENIRSALRMRNKRGP
jgi:hypothetical protein